MVRNYRDLVAWQRAMSLAEEVYGITRSLPPEERYVLSPQIRKAAVSVPSNIAEGHGSQSDRVLARHLAIAHGSLCELETQLLLAGRFGYVGADDLQKVLALASEVGRLIQGLNHAVSGE